MRIAIAGAPRAGKTTLGRKLAGELKCKLQSADDLIATHDWSAASAEVARRLAKPGPYVVEGVAVLRALRKALDASAGKPCDRLLWLDRPHQELTGGQRRMFEADSKRLAELEPELRRRGVDVVRGGKAQAPAPKAHDGSELPEHERPQVIGGSAWGGHGFGRGF